MLLWLVVSLTGCFRQEVVTVDIAIPQMKAEPCAELVLQSLQVLEAAAILDYQADLDRRVLRLTYNTTRLALKNIEHAIAAAGFDANDVSAAEEARAALPALCR